ncbi:hypothetical protein [Sphingobacterium sp. MYb382]|uniref:hypothetical protein n=1 Tax=Sphingobacterium sp. MYb382 TaxID=2745278 RepID=UPI0030A7E3CC
MENTVQYIKEFIWDILGYLIPGALLLILMEIIFEIKAPYSDNNIVFFITSYIIGYIIYGINVVFYDGDKPVLAFKKRIEEKIKNRDEFSITLKKLNTKFNRNYNNKTAIRTIRSLAMSYIPDADAKIYTHTFRSELSNSCATLNFIIGIVSLILLCFQKLDCINVTLIKNFSPPYVVFYILLISSSYFLNQARNKFYSMSMSLPLSIFATKDI